MNLLFLFTFLVSGLTEAASVSSINVKSGRTRGDVSALAQASEGRQVVLISPSNGVFDATFLVSASGLAGELSLSSRISAGRSRDQFTYQYLNSSGAYVALGVKTGTGYSALKYALPEAAIVQGAITIRILSSRAAERARLDSLIITASGSVTPPPPPPPTEPPPPPPPPTSGAITPGTTWYWQLQGTLRSAPNAKVQDIDLFDQSAATMASLKAAGYIVICYFSGGTYENWRPDASSFPAASLGANMDDWPGERWLDVRNLGMREVMKKRLDLAKSKGCDGVEPDNVDGYSNRNGVGLTKADQIAYNGWLADEARARGLKVALKNSTDLVTALVDKFDFAVVEECFAYNECAAYTPFIKQGKAVLSAEYSKYSAATCDKAKALGLSTVFFNLDLDGRVYQPCP